MAHVRGYFARKKLLEVRKEFEGIFEDLQSDAEIMRWERNWFVIGRPLISTNRSISKDENDWRKLKSFSGNVNDGILKKEDKTGNKGSDAERISNDVFEGEFKNPRETRTNDDENVELSGFRMDDNIEIGKDDVLLPERTPISEKCDQGLNQNEEDFPHGGNPQSPGHPKDQVISSTERDPDRMRYLTEIERLEPSDDKQPHKCSDVSSQHFPFSSTPRLVSSDGQEIKNSGSRETSGIAAPMTRSQTQARHYLHDQALLSDSWMTDKSFDPVIGNDSTTLDPELPGDAEKLRELRDHVAMELLWTEQAIQSRKKVSYWYDLRTSCFTNLYQH